MQPARSPESNERVVTRIVASLDCDHSQNSLHISIGDIDDPLGEFFRCKIRRSFHLFNSRSDRIDRELHPTSQKIVWMDPPEEEIRICYRESRAAFSVTDRAWHRTRALRADLQCASSIYLRYRTAPCADRSDIDDRDTD